MAAWGQPDLFTKRVRKPPPAPERNTQIWLADLLDKYGGLAPGWDWFHIPNGELRSEATGALLKRMGAKPGVLDLEFLSPNGKAHFLELKRGRARLTEAQEAFIARNQPKGFPCAVAHSAKEAIAILKGWGAIRMTVTV